MGQTVHRTLYAVAGMDSLAGAAAPLYEELRPWRRHQGVEELLPLPQRATGSGALLAIVDWGDAAGRVGNQPILYRGSQLIQQSGLSTAKVHSERFSGEGQKSRSSMTFSPTAQAGH